MKNNCKYEVVIVGSGIGGLVCGCYLAKAGLKVFMVEKHNKVGGYCTSFERGGHHFDVGVHYFGSCRKGGVLNNIITDFSLKDDLRLCRIDPSDKIIMPDHVVFIRKDYEKTRDGLKRVFYDERKSIDNFFNFILQEHFYAIYMKLFDKSFKDLLNAFFINCKLKSTLSVLLGNIGLPASKTPALSAAVLFREYICDPGYYPEDGIQAFPNFLMKRFCDYGGKLKLSSEVTEIIHKDAKALGVKLSDGTVIRSRFVVSNADATETFKGLLKGDNGFMNNKLKKLKLSVSPFVSYLGVEENVKSVLKDHCTIWYFKTYDIESCYSKPINPTSSSSLKYFICNFPSFHLKNREAKNKKASMQIIVSAEPLSAKIWDSNKEKFARRLINEASRIIPSLSKYVKISINATPQDFYKYTYNKNGAMYGWAALKNQIGRAVFPQRTPIKNLYLAGHWATNGLGQSGIPAVAFSGKSTARLILSEIGKNRKRYI